MKVLGSRVTFVRRSSAAVVILTHMYVDMKVWSRMFAVTVQSVSIQQMKWSLICWFTQTTNSFAAFCVENVSNVKLVLNDNSTDVLVTWQETMIDQHYLTETEGHLFIKMYCCSLCDKSFSHICQKKFDRSGTLKTHVLISPTVVKQLFYAGYQAMSTFWAMRGLTLQPNQLSCCPLQIWSFQQVNFFLRSPSSTLTNGGRYGTVVRVINIILFYLPHSWLCGA